MPPPPVVPVRIVAILMAAATLSLALAGCQSGPNTRSVPSVAQIGSGIKCPSGDHGFSDDQAGWGFCYPGTWKYDEKSQGSASPPGLDLTFDITDVPCVTPGTGSGAGTACTPAPPCVSPAPGIPPQPNCSTEAGLFAFMIISTYERGAASTLAAWELENMHPVPSGETISWGNSIEAVKLADGRRLALTQHHVVILDLHSGTGHLDLEAQMATRLSTWKFTF